VGLHYVQLFPERPHLLGRLHQHPGAGGRSRCWCSSRCRSFSRLLLNEVARAHAFKRIVQSVSYLPHFLSIVVVAGIAFQFLAVDGAMKPARGGRSAAHPSRSCSSRNGSGRSTSRRRCGRPSAGGRSSTWPRLTTIDPSLYEAARIDGANRWQQTLARHPARHPGHDHDPADPQHRHVSWQSVSKKILLLYNPLTYPTADVITTYLYRMGRGLQQLQLRPRRSGCSKA